MLGGLTIHPAVVNCLWCTCTKNYKSLLAVDKVIRPITAATAVVTTCKNRRRRRSTTTTTTTKLI